VQVSGGPATTLSFSIITGDTPELADAANLIKEQLGALGVQVDVKVYGTGELNQLIRSRNYEALFFGQIVNHESDLYSFWHSSQITDPGLNIGMYQSKAADTILENAQKTLDSDTRKNLYDTFITQFNKDLPSLLIYSPKYLYATKSKLSNVDLETLTIPSDRFNTVYTWYADTDHIWKIFNK
jgi:peptide/nickel transport system substrate-binding protein